MNIFTYDELKNKARREIDRLIQSEAALDEQSSIDHALNAAFTIYHLIQWRQETENSNIKIKVHDYIMSSTNKGLQILHNVVTCNKHVTVTTKIYLEETNPRLENNINYILTGDGETLIAGDGKCVVAGDSNIKVHFGDLQAVVVLEEALREFD